MIFTRAVLYRQSLNNSNVQFRWGKQPNDIAWANCKGVHSNTHPSSTKLDSVFCKSFENNTTPLYSVQYLQYISDYFLETAINKKWLPNINFIDDITRGYSLKNVKLIEHKLMRKNLLYALLDSHDWWDFVLTKT